MKRLLSLLLCLLLACSAAGCARQGQEKARVNITASFYPMYIILMNITEGIEDVRISSMAGQQTGCLHDFQMSTDDMKNLESADAFVINGAGMESFLTKVTSEIPGLTIIDSSKGIDLIEGDGTHHEHEGEDDGHDHGDMNPHIFVSVSGYIKQVENIRDGLIRLDEKNAQHYRQNAEAYLRKLNALKEEMHQELADIKSRDIITFHEAFPYFAEEFGLHIVSVINREPDSQPSARELAETIRQVRETGVRALFVEPQYPKTAAHTIADETGAGVYVLDPCVTGVEDKDAYLNAMRENLTTLKKALG